MTTFDFGFGPVPAHQHPNGRGWVADTAHVDDSAYIGPDARVFGDARVSGNARVSGDARVFGDARVYGDAWVSGDAWVFGNAQVYGGAQVYGDARVYGDAWVYGGAQVSGGAWVFGNAQVSGGAKLAKSSDYLLIGPIGSRAAFMTWTRSDNCIATGCFRGTIKEFLAAVRETHGDNEHAQAYRAAVEFIRAMEKQP